MRTLCVVATAVTVLFALLALPGSVPALAQDGPGSHPERPEASLYDDEFNGPTLNSRWTWYYQDPSRWSLTASPGNLRITGTGGDMWFTCNNPKNLLMQSAPAGDYEIVTKLTVHPTTDFQQGGLMVYSDLGNYVRIQAAWNQGRGGTVVEFIYESGDFPPFSWPQVLVDLNQPIHLKIKRVGSQYTGYLSSDGTNWTYVDAISAPVLATAKIGVFALNAGPIGSNCVGTGTDIPVDFDYFRVTNNTISGHVLDAFGQPMPSVQINSSANITAITDINGNYTLGGLPPGTYTIMPFKSGIAFAPPSRNVQVPPNAIGQDFQEIASQLKPIVVLVHGWQGLNPSWSHSCKGTGVTKYPDSKSAYFVDDGGHGLPEWLDQLGFSVYFAHLDTSIAGTPTIETNAECLRDQIDQVVDENSGQKVILIAHSMGGLVSRACLDLVDCRHNVSALYTLGTPNAGINTAFLMKMLAFRQISFAGRLAVCAWQRAACQFTTDGIALFNLFHANPQDITYAFIGGTRMNQSILGGLLYPLDGLNDGMVGSNSAVGWSYPIRGNVVRGVIADGYWTSETHTSRVGHPTYFEPSAGSESQAFRCLAWLLGKRPRVDCPLATPGVATLAASEFSALNTTPTVYGTLSSNQVASHTLQIDSSSRTTFYLSWLTGTFSLTLTDPGGQLITPDYAFLHPEVVTYAVGPGSGELPQFAAYSFTTTVPGPYILSVAAQIANGSAIDYSAFAALEAPRALSVTTDSDMYQIGQTANFTAVLQTTGALSGGAVSAELTWSDGTTRTLVFNHAVGDVFTASAPITGTSGYLQAVITASGSDDGITFQRQVERMLGIAPSGVQWSGSIVDRAEDSDHDTFNDILAVDVGLISTRPSTLTFSADLIVSGQIIAHTGAYIKLPTGSQTATLHFDGWDIRRAQLDGPYTVANLYLIDVDAGALPMQSIVVAGSTAAYKWTTFGYDRLFLPVVMRNW